MIFDYFCPANRLPAMWPIGWDQSADRLDRSDRLDRPDRDGQDGFGPAG